MYFATVWLLRDGRKRQKQNPTLYEDPPHYWLVFALSTGLLCMITIYLFAQNFFGEEMWIIHEGYPGGSGQYYADHAAVWYQTMGSASSVVMNWMSDAYFVGINSNWTLILVLSLLKIKADGCWVMNARYTDRMRFGAGRLA